MRKALLYLGITVLFIFLTLLIVSDIWAEGQAPTKYDKKQDTKIRDNKIDIKNIDNTLIENNNRITSNTNIINNNEERLNDLLDTEYCIREEVQFIREKNFTVGVYGKTDIRHSDINNEVGINFVIGLGKSWEEVEFEKIEKRIKELEREIK